MGLIATRAASFVADMLGCCTGCLMTLVLGNRDCAGDFFVNGLVILFASATMLLVEASINSSDSHFVSASI